MTLFSEKQNLVSIFYLSWNLGRSVYVVSELSTGRMTFDSQHGQECFLLTAASSLALGPHNLLSNGYRLFLRRG